MFAGIIATVGTIVGVEATLRQRGSGGLAHRLDVDLGPLADGLRVGASVAVNGACLTIADLRGRVGSFDVVPETWRRTTVHEWARGALVNLERALRAGEPVDGHFVQGHVEDIGTVRRVERGGGEWRVWIEVVPALMPAIIPKGSIALDGTSLTVVDVEGARFSVVLVPVTLERTVLGRRRVGDHVNVETDLLARLLVRRIEALVGTPGAPVGTSGLSWEKLRASGFLS